MQLQKRLRRLSGGIAGLVFVTAISGIQSDLGDSILAKKTSEMRFFFFAGAFVAGLDAGLIYNDFPFMGGQLIPSEIMSLVPKWKNFFENDVTVQFQHRVLGITTWTSIATLWLWARKVPYIINDVINLSCRLLNPFVVTHTHTQLTLTRTAIKSLPVCLVVCVM